MYVTTGSEIDAGVQGNIELPETPAPRHEPINQEGITMDEDFVSVDMEDLNPPVTFYYQDKAPVQIRTCPFDVLIEIEKQCKKTKIEYKSDDARQLQRLTYDANAENEEIQQKRRVLIWDYCIAGWSNLKNKKGGSDIPCTTENKALLMVKVPAFAMFVNNALERLRKDNEIQTVAAQKNDETS